MKYLVEFDRISRDHYVPPLTIEDVYPDAGNAAKGSHPGPEHEADRLAEVIYRYAYQRTISRDIEVVVDLDEMTGTIYAGLHVAGSFTLKALPETP